MDIEKNEILENEHQEQPQQEINQPTAPNAVAAAVNPQPYQPKPLFEISKKDTVFALLAVAACVFTAVFGLFSGFALGFAMSQIVSIAVMTVYFVRRQRVVVTSALCGVLALINSVTFITTSNGSVKFFAVVTTLLLSLVFFDGVVNRDTQGNRAVLGIFYSALSSMGNIGVSVKSLFSKSDGSKKSVGKAIIGVLCALPVLCAVVPLLISSDDAFKGLVESIFDNTFETVLKVILGIGISFFVVSYGLSLKKQRVAKVKEGTFGGIENVYIISFLSVIGLCYLLYLFSQFAYFFSAFKGFLPEGYEFDFSGYARKGFFEMCIIAVINLGVVFLSVFLAKKQNGKPCDGIKALCTFVSVFTLIIIVTAISKMVLYINEYGMTVLRITTSAFMLFLSVVFISVILRIYITKINVVKTSLITAGIIVMLLGVANVNAVCAKYNYDSFMNGRLKSIDVEAMYDLGDEGIPYITKLAYSENGVIAREAQECLSQAYLYDYFDDMQNAYNFNADDLKKNQRDKGFEYFSIPKNRAYAELYEFIEKNPQFGSWCYEYTNAENSDYIW